jgi:hypothetical protein
MRYKFVSLISTLKFIANTEKREAGAARYTTFNGAGNEFKVMITKVPKQCPLVPLVKVAQVRIMHLEVEKV